MTNVQGVHQALAPKPVEHVSPVVSGMAPANPAGVSDVVEISTAAMLAAKIHEIPEIRADLVARVKSEIAAGTYETPERLEAAIDGLMADLYPELL